jgi:hypothetical protein
MRQRDGLLAAQGREGRRLCDRDAGARAQRERDVAGAEDFISRGEAALGTRETGGRRRCARETGRGSREEVGRAGAAHRHAWRRWDSG